MESNRVSELLDSKGEAQGWKCPGCGAVKSSAAAADACLRGHSRQLHEAGSPPANLTED